MIEILSWLVAGYAAICIAGFFAERLFMYFPDRTRVAPKDIGLHGVEEIEVPMPDGKTLVSWYAPGPTNKPTIVYFHGNAGNAASRADKIATIQSAGYGVIYINARGYGGSEGRPSEAANVTDAMRIYDYLRGQGRTPEQIILYGESLGTGTVVQLAAERPVRAVILEAPLTSTVDVAKSTYWFLPLRLIMSDQWRTIDHIKRVKAPILIVHGELDAVIPVSHAKKLHVAATGPVALTIFPDGGHSDLFDHGSWGRVSEFLDKLPDRAQ